MLHILYLFCRGKLGEGNRKNAVIKCFMFKSNVLPRTVFKNHIISQKKIV